MLSSILAALIAMGLLWELFSRQKRRTLKLCEKGKTSPASLKLTSVVQMLSTHFITKFFLFTICFLYSSWTTVLVGLLTKLNTPQKIKGKRWN